VARGTYVSFTGSRVEFAPESLAICLRVHRSGYALVTGTVLNGTRTTPGWASYFLDHAGALPGWPSSVLKDPPVGCSYLRSALSELGGFPEDLRSGEEVSVNQELFGRGYSAFREQNLRLVYYNDCATLRALVRYHFQRGRTLGTILIEDAYRKGIFPTQRILGHVAWFVERRLGEVAASVGDHGAETRPHFRRAKPLVLVGVLTAWIGSLIELALRAPRAAADLWWPSFAFVFSWRLRDRRTRQTAAGPPSPVGTPDLPDGLTDAAP
jgi:hypothetical protein